MEYEIHWYIVVNEVLHIVVHHNPVVVGDNDNLALLYQTAILCRSSDLRTSGSHTCHNTLAVNGSHILVATAPLDVLVSGIIRIDGVLQLTRLTHLYCQFLVEHTKFLDVNLASHLHLYLEGRGIGNVRCRVCTVHQLSSNVLSVIKHLFNLYVLIRLHLEDGIIVLLHIQAGAVLHLGTTYHFCSRSTVEGTSGNLIVSTLEVEVSTLSNGDIDILTHLHESTPLWSRHVVVEGTRRNREYALVGSYITEYIFTKISRLQCLNGEVCQLTALGKRIVTNPVHRLGQINRLKTRTSREGIRLDGTEFLTVAQVN